MGLCPLPRAPFVEGTPKCSEMTRFLERNYEFAEFAECKVTQQLNAASKLLYSF